MIEPGVEIGTAGVMGPDIAEEARGHEAKENSQRGYFHMMPTSMPPSHISHAVTQNMANTRSANINLPPARQHFALRGD